MKCSLGPVTWRIINYSKQNNIDGLFTIGDLSMNATKSFGKGAFHFSNYDELGESLTRILNKDTNILVKGSRAMKLDKIIKKFY